MNTKELTFNTDRGYSAEGQIVTAIFLPRRIDDNGDQVGAIEFVDVTRGIDGRYENVAFINREIDDRSFQIRVMSLYDHGGYSATKVIYLVPSRRDGYTVGRYEPATDAPDEVPADGWKFRTSNPNGNIIKALNECFVGGHVSHIRNPANGRIVAIRPWYVDQDRDDDAFTLTFSDPKVDLRKTGDELIVKDWDEAVRVIWTFFVGDRCNAKVGAFVAHINQADRDVAVTKVTNTRARIEYWLPKSGNTGAWRARTTVGGFHYLRAT